MSMSFTVLRAASPQELDTSLRVRAYLGVSIAKHFQPLADVLAILVAALIALALAVLLDFGLRLLDGIVVAHELVHLNKVPDYVFVTLEPGVRERFLGRKTLIWVLLKHGNQELLAMSRNMLQVLLDTSEVASHVASECLVHVFSRKEIAASKQIEEDSAKTEYIGLVAVLFFDEHLRCHIARCPTLVGKLFIVRSEDREAKVCDAYFIL